MRSNNVKIPNCEAFQYEKQEINPKSGTRQINDKGLEGSLKINQLDTGKLIFPEQYESMILVILFGEIGYKVAYQVYKVCTIFYDASISRFSVHHQVSFTAE